MQKSEDNSAANWTFSGSPSSMVRTQAESLWASVLDASSDGISIHAVSGQIVWANRKLCEIYNKPIGELTGSSCQSLFHGNASGCPHEQVLASGSSAQPGEICVEGRILSLIVEPLLDQQGVVSGFVRVMKDITAEHRAKELLLTAERYASLGQILSGIAHDIGTPLNVISGYAEFLLMRMKPDGHNYKELSAILSQTRRIAAMVAQALDLARPPQGRSEAIETGALLTDAISLVGHYLHKTRVKADLTCRISPSLVYGEAPQLRQAFFNLLLNAAQQVGAGGRLEVVADEAPEKPGFLAVALSGIDASGVVHDFSQLGALLDEQSEAAIAGVGLSLAKEILHTAGAKVSSRAVGERGIAVMIYLPVSP